jgi:hypothetical protein
MSLRVVVAAAVYAEEVRAEFYFSSPRNFGGGAEQGDQVAVVSDRTGNLLALGEIVSEGKPYVECKKVKVTKRFE